MTLSDTTRNPATFPEDFLTLRGHRGPLDATADLIRNPLAGITITVDGPTASGKGTLAKELARRFRVKFLDTGSIYRAVAYRLAQLGESPEDPVAAERAAKKLVFDFRHLGSNRFGTFVHGEDATDAIRTPETGIHASIVSNYPPVRAALFNMQQQYVTHWQPLIGTVLDGRDTGGRIAPQAQIKFFITGDPAARAHRRWLDFQAAGKDISEEQTLRELLARDERDRNNTIQAEDAIVLDATHADAAEILHQALSHIEARFGPIPEGIKPE